MYWWPWVTARAACAHRQLTATGFSDGCIEVKNRSVPGKPASVFWHAPSITPEHSILPVIALAFGVSPSGSPLLASSGADSTIMVWAPSRGKWKPVFEDNVNPEATSLAFSGSSETLAIALADGRIRFRSVPEHYVESGGELTAPAGPVKVAFGPDDSEVVAGTKDGIVVRYVGWSEARRWSLDSEILAIAVGRHGAVGAVTKDAVRILDGQADVRLDLEERVKPIGCWWSTVTDCLTVAGERTDLKWMKYPTGQYRQFLGDMDEQF
jgi:hypothetical protein